MFATCPSTEWTARRLYHGHRALSVARMTGLDVVAITDHHRLVTPADRAVLDDLFPERILIPGVEITLSDVLEDSSDAHHCSDVGRHVTWLLEPVTTVDAILEAIRRGDGIPEHRAVR